MTVMYNPKIKLKRGRRKGRCYVCGKTRTLTKRTVYNTLVCGDQPIPYQLEICNTCFRRYCRYTSSIRIVAKPGLLG